MVLPLMAYLSQTLSDNANRWTNIIVGAVYAVILLVITVAILMDASVVAIIPAFGIVWSVLIVWTAWKSK